MNQNQNPLTMKIIIKPSKFVGLLETFFSSENFIVFNEKKNQTQPTKKWKILEEEGHENEDP